MKNVVALLFLSFSLHYAAQKKNILKDPIVSQKVSSKTNSDLIKINDSIPTLIPQKIDDKFGFINQKSKLIIKPEYSNVGFFTEDCTLVNSPNSKAKNYGSDKYASVRLNGTDFRINKAGKRVYRFKESDLGKCPSQFKSQLFHGYIMNKNYGIIEDSKFKDPSDYKQFTIYPQYDYLHIMEGDDLKNPMIVAVRNNKFGIIDVNDNIIVPFQYEDIKRNYSWKLARLFEVTEDGKNYFYIDISNQRY